MGAAVDEELVLDVVPAYRSEVVLGARQVGGDVEATVGAAGLGGVGRAVGVYQAGARQAPEFLPTLELP